MKGLSAGWIAAAASIAIASIVAVEAYGGLRSQVINNVQAIGDMRAVLETARARNAEERRAIGELASTTRSIEQRLDHQRTRIEQIYQLLIRTPNRRPGGD